MPGRRRPDDFSLFRKSQAPRFTGPGAEAKTGSGSAETENGRGGLAVSAAPCAMQVRLRRSDAEYILERRSCFSPGRVQRRRPVRVLPRRERLRGAVSAAPCAMQVRLRRSDAEYILERRSCFSPGRAQSRGLSDRIEEREATARTSRFFVSVPAADAACGARSGRAASAAGGCGSTARRAALRKSADA